MFMFIEYLFFVPITLLMQRKLYYGILFECSVYIADTLDVSSISDSHICL